ncbi:class Ib ribonucleoside-diphosphate reductase assembly flavoprotein NrdI [Enterococcus sp. LJL98]
MTINLLFMSISGNVRSFAKRIQQLSEKMQQEHADFPIIQIKEIHDNSNVEEEIDPYVVVVPTYLIARQGSTQEDQEIMTESLREYLEDQTDLSNCLGIIGSGNKNFAQLYCLTAKQYTEQFDLPLLAEFEMRGNPKEIETIYQIITQAWQASKTEK